MHKIARIRGEIARMAGELFEIVEISFEETTELQRQLLASFVFGMVFAVGQFEELTPPEVHALVIAYLRDVFRYSDQQAVDFAQHLIDSASGRGNPTITAVIHRGIDGHRQWQERQPSALRTNVEEVFAAVGA